MCEDMFIRDLKLSSWAAVLCHMFPGRAGWPYMHAAHWYSQAEQS